MPPTMRHDLLARRESSVGIASHQPDAFDAADLRHVAPGALAEIDLGVIETEGLHLDHDMARLRLGIGALLDRQHVGAAILLDHDGTHHKPPRLVRALVKPSPY